MPMGCECLKRIVGRCVSPRAKLDDLKQGRGQQRREETVIILLSAMTASSPFRAG